MRDDFAKGTAAVALQDIQRRGHVLHLEGDDRAMQLLLIMDDKGGSVLQGRPVFAGDLKEAADSMVDTFFGKGLGKVKGRNCPFS